jgi:glycosyltransferase involved in cell wall biosynthesis
MVRMMKFLIALPTFNRALTILRAIDSLVAQTHKDWHCWVLDDGSTDSTRLLMTQHEHLDPRVHYVRHDTNQGAVVMNNLSMARAIALNFDAWVRLGSDDWFLPWKLELDALALEHHGACFGPYRNNPESYGGELNGPQDARAALLRGEFAASWANIAVRTDTLRAVHKRHGDFVDTRLRNMEDYLFNVRMARVTDIAWRGMSEDGTSVCIGAQRPEDVGFAWQPDARYNVGADGASEGGAGGINQREVCARDADLTVKIRGEDHYKGYEVATFSPQMPRVVRRVV